MSRNQVIGVSLVLALGGSAGATALDAALADLDRLPHMIHTAAAVVFIIPVWIALLFLFVGGLPLAVIGLLRDRRRALVPIERRRYLRVPYAVLVFQATSVFLSGLWLVVIGPDLRWAFSYGVMPWWPVYLGVQSVTGIAAIPAWRRQIMNASVVRPSMLFTDSLCADCRPQPDTHR